VRLARGAEEGALARVASCEIVGPGGRGLPLIRDGAGAAFVGAVKRGALPPPSALRRRAQRRGRDTLFRAPAAGAQEVYVISDDHLRTAHAAM